MSDNKPVNFIRQIIDNDLVTNKFGGRVHTRFPPEPNGYLHVGHAKAICLNFGIANDYPNAKCNLRFDDTNPEKEEVEYIDSIKEDVAWLGFTWHDEPLYASNYFQQLYEYAIELIKAGKAYVDSLSAEEIREYRGTLTEPGKDSPYRNRSVEENLKLFEEMKLGKHPEGSLILRAKIDMASPNINMRDPAIYRIRFKEHVKTGSDWCIYPMYDYTHCISDALENITHSLCTLEFADHRALYDWVLDNINIDAHPQQIEFSRLNLEHTVTSKRKLNQLVKEKIVAGFDDPRMPTISGMRRRGFTPASIRDFCHRVGVTKKDNVIEYGVLENCVREDLDASAPRAMAVLDPLKIVIENYPEAKVELLTAPCHPQKDLGTRTLPFTREIYIDKADFRETANKKYKRMILEGEVRLRNAYVIKCHKAVKDRHGQIVELRCTYDENTLGKNPEGRKVRGVIHWVSASHGIDAEVRLYDRLFLVPNPGAMENFFETINPDSLKICQAKVEPSLAETLPESRFQFEREGYFCADRHDYQPGNLVFNRIVTLRDSWAKIEAKGDD